LPADIRLRVALVLLIVLTGSSATLLAQEGARPLPEVTEHGTVVYPPLARQARIVGQVLLRVTTDGHVVTDVVIEKGHPLLTQSAEANVRTWKFVDHVPGTFEVAFDYRVQETSVAFLKQPGLVEVVDSPEGGISSYALPEKWNVHLRNSQGTIDASLTLWTYRSFEPRLDGYTTGPQGQERDIREPHIDGDMLGFDTTLDDKYGQRLKFSMIGRMSGDKIKGVFLSYWGVGGTWTAERAAKAVSDESSTPPANVDVTPITESEVAYHEYARYSRFANDAGIQGAVQLRVTSDGYSLTKIEALSGNVFLVRDAISNLRTWRFGNHNARTFDVTYSYQLLKNKVEFLKEPGVVEIDSVPPIVNPDTEGFPSNPREIWQMQLTSSRGTIRSTLSLGMSYYVPDGYVTADTGGLTGQKEAIHGSHEEWDILGFDATLKGPNGGPLKVSVLGKKTRNKITGVFLDESGTPGTWTALRQPPPTKPTR
jgi:hypothetical protein